MRDGQSFILTKTFGYDAKKKACVETYWLVNENTQKRKKISKRKYERIIRRLNKI